MATAFRFLVVLLLAIAVPFQAALAVTGGQCKALESHHGMQEAHHEHEGHDDHDGKPSATHCEPCCTAVAIAGVAPTTIASSGPGMLNESPGLPLPSAPPRALDRPPLAP
jgi:hypothetical protein